MTRGVETDEQWRNFCKAIEREDLTDDPRITIISKGTDESADGYSGFDGTNLAQLLREKGVAEVWVGGLATDYCVKHTVLDARRARAYAQLCAALVGGAFLLGASTPSSITRTKPMRGSPVTRTTS